MGVNVDLLLADDQLQNRFVITFPNGIPGSSINPELISLRINGSFSTPEYSVSKYDISYRGMKLAKTGGSQENSNEFNLNFRIDVNWEVYKALKGWMDMIFNPLSGQYTSDNENRTTMVFTSFGARDIVVKQTIYKWVRIYTLKGGDFDTGEGQPVNIEAGFVFGYREEQ
jgi:hypothetical protein